MITKYQSENGAFIACPNFKSYQYAWFRDGAFCAYALTKAGYVNQARRFFEWSSQVVNRYQKKIEACIKSVQNGETPTAENCFHSRFTLEGYEVPGGWGHHQLDGLGTWLWALKEFLVINPDQTLPAEWKESTELIGDYLSAMWQYPCSDCWEENETGQHTYTLASVAAGLQCYSQIFDVTEASLVSAKIIQYIEKNCIYDGFYTKSVGSRDVDANLMALVYPLHIVNWGNPVFQKTLTKITEKLTTPIGVHRYPQDTYYGGGEWVLLTEWLGWSYAKSGQIEKADTILKWAAAQASAELELPEQIPHALFSKIDLGKWLDMWGPIASPLLWSHAMYVLLVQSLEEMTRDET